MRKCDRVRAFGKSAPLGLAGRAHVRRLVGGRRIAHPPEFEVDTCRRDAQAVPRGMGLPVQSCSRTDSSYNK